jgi:hypothetical protein
MQADQAAAPHASLDLSRGYTGTEELRTGDQTVLALGDPRENSVDSPGWGTHTVP